MIVDSSVWIDLLNGRSGPHTARLAVDLLEDETQIVLGDLILHEILRGIKDGGRRASILNDLRELTVVEMVDTGRAIRAADRYAELRARGLTVRNTVDVLIASYCIDEDEPLLFADRDYLYFVDHFGLRRA